ncbi:MAG: hydrogenase nickel incorporation protein HypB [Anaerolineales bacterium]|nr:hydrogenase nickel incorporation protein HypB [Anaerolineales bacterium]
MVKKVSIVEKIHSANDQLAAENRQRLDRSSVFSLNFMASPGAGKTSLIERTLHELTPLFNIAVIDGDVATSIDANRAAEAGATAVQINTGGQCHIDANMLQKALNELDLDSFDLLLVENVGNLICPASFQLGTHKNLLIASIPEGDDKPYKYPAMYQDVDALIINKIDLLPYVDFDMPYFEKGVQILNPDLVTFPVSCRTEEGIQFWIEWLKEQIDSKKNI